MISKKVNSGYDAVAPNGIPDGAGDRYRSQDLFRDFQYLIDRLGYVRKDECHHIPFHENGGAVWQGAGATFNITLGHGYVKFSVQTPLSFAASPPTTQDEDIESIRVNWAAQTDLVIAGYTAGGATNYLKVAYKDTDGTSRARFKKAGNWAYDSLPDSEFSADTTPPTDYEICLTTFTEAAGTFTFTPYYYPFLKPTHRAGHIYPLRNVLVSNWTERDSAKNYDLYGISWSPELSLFCAVGVIDGVDAYILTSLDGIDWTERANPKNFNLRGISWSPELSLYCAVGVADGVDAYIITSPDGITWLERANPKNFELNGVTWSPDLSLFCAVGEADGTDAYIVTSPDGITWLERANPKNVSLYGISWSPDLSLFCAVGYRDGVDAYTVTSMLN